MSKELKKDINSGIAIMNGKFVEIDDKVNYEMKAAEKCIKNQINEFKKEMNDESADKNLETLTKDVKNWKAKNDKLVNEITSVRRGFDK